MSGEGMIAETRQMHGEGVQGEPGSARLAELMHRGTAFLGTRYAILGGAMSWVSERNLVSARATSPLPCRARASARRWR